MKKLIILNLTMVLSCFIGMACDDDASVSEQENGKSCASASECISKYCSPEHVCAQKPANLLENGAACTSGEVCLR